MKKYFFALLLGVYCSSAQAEIGFNFGFGVPYLTQGGINYFDSSRMFSAELGYNALHIAINDVAVGLNKAEFSLRFHPFAGAFYMGVGVGQQTLYSEATKKINTESVRARYEVKSSTVTPQVGWMWGATDGGFFFGMDIGLQKPSGAKGKLSTNASDAVKATQEYQDMVRDADEQAEIYGETDFMAFTLARFGWLF